MTYQQAFNRQKMEKQCGVVLIERFPDKYRLTRGDGLHIDTTIEFGVENWPIVICGREK